MHNKRLLATCLYSGLHPTMIAAHIAAVSNVPRRRKRRPVWVLGLAVVVAVVAAWR